MHIRKALVIPLAALGIGGLVLAGAEASAALTVHSPRPAVHTANMIPPGNGPDMRFHGSVPVLADPGMRYHG